MGKHINKIKDLDIEEMRKDFCIEMDYNEMKKEVDNIRLKLNKIKKMMTNQLKNHKRWDNPSMNSKAKFLEKKK